jgi:hypothetical protein
MANKPRIVSVAVGSTVDRDTIVAVDDLGRAYMAIVRDSEGFDWVELPPLPDEATNWAPTPT